MIKAIIFDMDGLRLISDGGIVALFCITGIIAIIIRYDWAIKNLLLAVCGSLHGDCLLLVL